MRFQIKAEDARSTLGRKHFAEISQKLLFTIDKNWNLHYAKSWDEKS
jgi:hypothetical protein